MINLDALMEKTFQFRLNGQIINCNQPSAAMVRKYRKRFIEESDDIEVQTDYVFDILNNNTSGVEFTKKQVEELPLSVSNLVAETVNNGIRKIESDPN